MKKNEISEKAHNNAVVHGFWAERKSNEHCLMLICTEVAELIEADREDKWADMSAFESSMSVGSSFEWAFENCLKNTFEDEFADIYIRLADLAGALGVDFEKMSPCRYFRAFDKFSFTENAFALVKGLSKDKIGIEKRIQFGMDFVENWASEQVVNLELHVKLKMQYNQQREEMHGKKY